jgi:hypothetical protein
VPVTATLSKAFYDKFGDAITNELVNWFNAVDDTYRAELRELNELNFARFDAKVGERLAELDAKWAGRWTELDHRIAALDAKLDQRLAALDAKLDQRLADVRGELKAGLADLRGELKAGLGALGGELKADFSDRLRNAEIRLAGLTIAWVPVVLGIFEFVFRR